MKYLLLGVSYLFTSLNKGKNEIPSSLFPIQILKNALEKEISLIIYKALLGLLLVSIMILCINQSSKSFSLIMNQIEYGYVYEFFILIALAGLSGFFLHRMFKMNPMKSNSVSSEEELPLKNTDLNSLKNSLIKGFLEGIESRTQAQTESKTQKTEKQTEKQNDYPQEFDAKLESTVASIVPNVTEISKNQRSSSSAASF